MTAGETRSPQSCRSPRRGTDTAGSAGGGDVREAAARPSSSGSASGRTGRRWIGRRGRAARRGRDRRRPDRRRGHGSSNTRPTRDDAGRVREPAGAELRASGSAPTSAGRDLFVRTMYGARTSLIVGIAASGIAVLIGLVVGLARWLLRRLERHAALARRRRDALPARTPDRSRDRRRVQHDRKAASTASIQPGIPSRRWP